MSDVFDELRIMAQDGGRLSTDDRAKLVQAADQYESMARDLIASNLKLIEANNHRIAQNEAILTLRRSCKPNTKPMSMGFSFRCVLNWKAQ